MTIFSTLSANGMATNKILPADDLKEWVSLMFTPSVLIELVVLFTCFGCIVVDSVTSFAPLAKFDGSAVMGIESRVNSDKMRMVMTALEKSDTCLIFIQQIRQKIGGMGDPTTVSGGLSIPFYDPQLRRYERRNFWKNSHPHRPQPSSPYQKYSL